MSWCYFSPETCMIYGFPTPEGRIPGTTVHGQRWVEGAGNQAWHVVDFVTAFPNSGFVVPSYCARPTPPSSPPANQPSPQPAPPQSAPVAGQPGSIDAGGAKGPITGDRCAPALQNSIPTLTGPGDDPKKTLAEKLEANEVGHLRAVNIPSTITGDTAITTRPAIIVFNPDGSIKGRIPGTGPGFFALLPPELGIQHVFGHKGAGGANDFVAFPAKLSQTGLLFFNDVGGTDNAKSICGFGRAVAGSSNPADGGFFDLDTATGKMYWRATNSSGTVTASYDLTLIATVPTAASTTEVLTGTDSSKYVTCDALAALWEYGGTIASNTTISVGEGGYFVVTGNTTIDDIDFATDTTGRVAVLVFSDASKLTYNATTLKLPTGADITPAAGDTAAFVSLGADAVRCIWYQRFDGTALAGSSTSLTAAATSGADNRVFVAVGDSRAMETTPVTINPATGAIDAGSGNITTTGDVNGANAHFTGKLTVDGDIDPTALLIQQTSLGTRVLSLKSTATNDDPACLTYQNRVTSNNNTVTTLHTVDMSTQGTYFLYMRVIGVCTAFGGGGGDPAVGDSIAWEWKLAFKNVGGTVTDLSGSAPAVSFTQTDANMAANALTRNISGTNVQIQVAGQASGGTNSYVWHLTKLEVDGPVKT